MAQPISPRRHIDSFALRDRLRRRTYRDGYRVPVKVLRQRHERMFQQDV